MQSPFLRTAGPRFADREEVLALARRTAGRIVSRHPEVDRILLFGSFARKDYGARSDIDLLVVLKDSDKPMRERLEDFLDAAAEYPTDVFPLTETELTERIEAGDHFLARALAEGVQLYP